MDVRIQSIHFDASEQLQAFIQKLSLIHILNNKDKQRQVNSLFMFIVVLLLHLLFLYLYSHYYNPVSYTHLRNPEKSLLVIANPVIYPKL